MRKILTNPPLQPVQWTVKSFVIIIKFFPFETVISPPTLWIAAKNSTVLNVKWLPPKYGQDFVKEYRLFYDQLQDGKTEKGPFIIEKQHRSYSLEGLSKL